MQPEFVATWSYIEPYRDIIAGFAFLADQISSENIQRCSTLVPLIA